MRGPARTMPVHPHSGLATVTVIADGDVTLDDPQAGHGTIGYGGVERVRAGRGMWHGKELSAGTSPTVQGFQLWLALPPERENAEPEAQYIKPEQMPSIGPARLIVGAYAEATSPVRAPGTINYGRVTTGAASASDGTAAGPPAGAPAYSSKKCGPLRNASPSSIGISLVWREHPPTLPATAQLDNTLHDEGWLL
jgi:redox-sensitive bicupin YhaK (pirin superfamily)